MELVAGQYISDVTFEKSHNKTFDVFFAHMGLHQEWILSATNEGGGKWKLFTHNHLFNSIQTKELEEFIAHQFNAYQLLKQVD